MDIILPDKLMHILMMSGTFSIIMMIFLQNVKKQSFIKKSGQIWVLNLLFSFLLGIPFGMIFYNLSLCDSIWIGVFTFIGAPSIYQTLKSQNIVNYKPSSLQDTVSVPKENEIQR